ncbi:hypothetical protein DMA15_15805 [Streptomyces sp. WAC 01529]|uniref:hypothetical protein n=1 Tax=Streptomyces sp. WAC 01529 TaxID=2203205 RepID=UPI000F6CDE34|nr:hypothetical protein [Streptomyces sp. WAC 01529]AZM53858.1 hypothetical protein DMA15_15805 [Streptomyces sp. WAC 01529]
MVRNVLGTVLALIGATAAVWSPFRAWYDGRLGRRFRLDELFSGGGVTGADAELFGSLFLPFAFAALLTLVGLLLRSRLLVLLAGVVVLGFAVLWMVRQGQAEGSLTVSGGGSGLGLGVLAALGGGILLLLAAALMAGRRGGARRRSDRHENGGRRFGRRRATADSEYQDTTHPGYQDTPHPGYQDPPPDSWQSDPSAHPGPLQGPPPPQDPPQQGPPQGPPHWGRGPGN